MTDEQTALVAKARESVQAARLLAREGYHDFAASRAYYAMFYLAQAFLLGEGLAFSKHSAVIAAFGKHFAHAGKLPPEFHRYLIEAQDARNVGDYQIGPALTGPQAILQITRAQQFLELAEGLTGK